MQSTTLLDSLESRYGAIYSFKGKGKAMVSTRETSERVGLTFRTTGDSTYISIKNRIGMEAGRLLVVPDSIFFRDRLEKESYRYNKLDYYLPFPVNYVSRIPFMRLLLPVPPPQKVHSVWENDSYFLLAYRNKNRLYLEKETMYPRRWISQESNAGEFFTIEYSAYEQVDSYYLPRKIQLVRNSSESRLFLLVQELKVNPPDISFDKSIKR